VKRVLIVDDERDVAEALRELLSETYQVTIAYCGAEALRVLEAGHIDAVVLDLMMPLMNGEELMRELQARNLVVPVIFASAAADLPNRARRSNANDFIAKPFDITALEFKLTRLLGTDNSGGASNPGGASNGDSGAGEHNNGGSFGQEAVRGKSPSQRTEVSFFRGGSRHCSRSPLTGKHEIVRNDLACLPDASASPGSH
jgi:DNA-binding response OmpR family regulator